MRDGIGNELMAVFRDDLLRISHLSARDYEVLRYGHSDIEEGYEEQIEATEFRAPGQVIADRLDIIGVDAATALAYLDEALHPGPDIFSDPDFLATLDEETRSFVAQEKAFKESLDGWRWVELLAAVPADPPETADRTPPGSRRWLLEQIAYMDERFALRLVLLAFPHDEVVLDVTDLGEGGWLSEVTALATDAAQAITGMAGMHAPVVVLTEGRTDAEFLGAGLQVLYPHLTDLIRFLDYGGRPEGGVGALVGMIRAFAAAGIVNRIVAVFDNDTAAADALRALDVTKIPDRITIVRYPPLALAEQYPTLGPPTLAAPAGSVLPANVNGLAGSIELYLGTDVLTRADGTLYPVQWRSFTPALAAYQGEVIDKGKIHEAFRAKYALALKDPSRAAAQDWEGIRAILNAIRSAAQTISVQPGN
jgi:hypothetical protein